MMTNNNTVVAPAGGRRRSGMSSEQETREPTNWEKVRSTALRRDMWPFWLVVALSLIITIAAWQFEARNVEHNARQRFEAQTDEIMTRIRSVMDTYEQVLRGSVALFASVDRVTREKWRRYVSRLGMEQSIYGIGTVGFAEHIGTSEKKRHIQRATNDGIENYKITPEGDRGDYLPLVYLEPLDWQNREALGFDMYSDPVRRAAIELARESGKPALSARVLFAPETGRDQEAIVLLFMPIYRKARADLTLEQRRDTFAGVAFKPIALHGLIGRAIGYPGAETSRGIRFEILDELAGTDPRRLYASTLESDEVTNDPKFVRHASLRLFGRDWQFRFASLPSFESSIDRQSPLAVLLIGTIASALLGAVAWTIKVRHIVVAEAKARVDTELAERRRAERELRVNDTRLRLALTAGRMGAWEYNVETDETNWSPEMYTLVGRDDEESRPESALALDSIVYQDDLSRFQASLAKQLSDEDNSTYRDEFRIVRPDGEICWLDVRGQIRRKVDGRARDILAIATDISERKLAEERERLLMSELRHRGNNLLAVLQSIASHSLSGKQTLAEGRDAFLRRLQSLARTDSILTDTAWKGASLADIVRLELDAFSDRTETDGPPIMLKPVMAQTFALVIHELATNALKYGALSVPSGKVSVRWHIEGDGQDASFKFRWQESDGPPVVPPGDTGFGSTLLERVFGMESERGGRIDFAPAGLIYTFEILLDEVSARTGRVARVGAASLARFRQA